jgi:hypothetical protein
MAFVLTITLWSLAIQAQSALGAVVTGAAGFDTTTINGVVALLLAALAVMLLLEAARELRAPVAAANGRSRA